jgi:hypothetical protein
MKIFKVSAPLVMAAGVLVGPMGCAQDAPAASEPVAAATRVDRTRATAPLSALCREEKNWRFGIALGFGERTNPLVQSEDIPVLVDLDIAWFGERWFFDN